MTAMGSIIRQGARTGLRELPVLAFANQGPSGVWSWSAGCKEASQGYDSQPLRRFLCKVVRARMEH
jgi:hypothetical protein